VPELAEVECVCRALRARVVARRVVGVRLRRRDVLRVADADGALTRLNGDGVRVRRLWLLNGQVIERVVRHGKQLAIVGAHGRVVCVHLGMSGQLRFVPRGERLERADHVHCAWRVQGPAGVGRLVFRDPRRFGGLWAYPSLELLRRHRWAALGPDALTVRADVLFDRVRHTSRAIKAALLDQQVIAGLGNIYVDEALFAAGIHPQAPASQLPREKVGALARAIRRTLDRSIAAGGSSLRDYVDGDGVAGRFTSRLAVYGRSGWACRRCGQVLARETIAQRTTVFCGACQPLGQFGQLAGL